jgi:hypothetical protein
MCYKCGSNIYQYNGGLDWGGVNANGETKAQNKHFPYQWPICPQYLQKSQEDESGCAIKIGVVSIDEVVIGCSFYSTFMCEKCWNVFCSWCCNFFR